MGSSCCKGHINTKDRIKLYPSNFYRPHEIKSTQSSNRVRTTKYRFYNFIFLNIFEQLKRYSNLFFIFCVILNFIPAVGTFSKETAIVPILFILLTTLIKDGVEDLRRFISDKKVNNLTVLKYDGITNQFVPNQWKNIKVGDFIQISSSERIPADLLLYYSSDVSGICFIETADIDGETTLKQRSIVKPITPDSDNPEEAFKHLYLEVEPANKEIYKFNGNVFDARNNRCVRSLKYTNMVLRDTILRNTNVVRGMVIYAGNETKIFMNNQKARFKRSLLENQLNIDMAMCILLLIIVCIMGSIGYSLWLGSFRNQSSVGFFIPNSFTTNNVALQGFIQFWTNIITYQSIIPIALYITLEFVKGHQIFHITNDLALFDEKLNRKIEAKAYNITEDMGQIKYMFCDKTGTLTDNVMIFRKASIFGNRFITNATDLKLKYSDLIINKSLSSDPHVIDFLMTGAICNTTLISHSVKKEKKLVHMKTDDKDSVITASTVFKANEPLFPPFFEIDNKFIFETIAPVILEDVHPIPKDLTRPNYDPPESSLSLTSYGRINKKNQNLFHRPLSNDELIPLILSESPDEDALVKMVMTNGYRLHHRSNENLLIWNDIDRKWMNYEILKTLPFDSVRKCMSVIVRDNETGQITLHCKGADSTILKKIVTRSQEEKDNLETTKSDIFEFASDGLRTLVMGQRVLEEIEFQNWENVLLKVEECLINNENAIKETFDSIENNLELVGAVGLEDKLQEFVPEILECLKDAGIVIWILTGDKRETAISISYSTKLFKKDDIVLELTSDNKEDLSVEIMSIRRIIEKSIYSSEINQKTKICKHDNFGLVIEGCSLSIILDSGQFNEDLKDEFLHIVYFCNSVVCCRCTPIQKGEVVRLIKHHFNVRTLGIGDGANDVNMIQTADIGIGISGKEGSQATMASDFAITKFKYLKRLILVHGHWSYDKLARLSLFLFYKDMLISMVLYFYQFVCGFSASTSIDQVTQIIFHIIHTGLPPIIYGIWDKDFSDEILMANPQIYKIGTNSKIYRPRDFWQNILDAIWQALCIFLIPWLCYRETEVDMGEFGIVSVSLVVIVMFAHLLVESKHWSPFHWAICLGCLAIGFYLELFIVNVMCVVLFDCYTDNPYKVLQHTMGRFKTYVVITVTTAAALFPRLFLKGILLESRKSIYYEAHRKLTQMKIPKWTSNILHTRKADDTDFEYDYKLSRFYLGDLEKFKTICCKKCDYLDKYFHKGAVKPTGKYRKSQVLPYHA